MSFYFTFNSKKSTDFGIKIVSSGHLQSPTRRFEQISIPGRTGDLIVDEGCYNNISFNIEGTISTQKRQTIAEAQTKLEEWLQSSIGYRTPEWLHSSIGYQNMSFSDGVNLKSVCTGIALTPILSNFAEITLQFSAYKEHSL